MTDRIMLIGAKKVDISVSKVDTGTKIVHWIDIHVDDTTINISCETDSEAENIAKVFVGKTII